MQIETIVYIIIFMIIGLLMQYFLQESRKDINRQLDGTLIIYPNKIYGFIGIIGIIISLLLTVYVVNYYSANNSTMFIVPILSILFFLTGSYLYFFSLRHRIIIKENLIRSISFWRKPLEINITEIRNISFSQNTQYLKISNGKTVIRVHMHLIGFQSFIEILRAAINEKANKKVLDELYL